MDKTAPSDSSDFDDALDDEARLPQVLPGAVSARIRKLDADIQELRQAISRKEDERSALQARAANSIQGVWREGKAAKHEMEGADNVGLVMDSRQSSFPTSSPPWRDMLIQQAVDRDEKTQGLTDLYKQYNLCLRTLHTMRNGSYVSQSFGSSSSSAKRDGLGQGASQTGAAQPTHTGGALPGAGQGAPISGRCDVADPPFEERSNNVGIKRELEALRQVVKEREEELQEKEQAHTQLSRQATLLARENSELKAQLAQLESSKKPVVGTCSDSGAPLRFAPHNRAGALLEEHATPILPASQLQSRKIHSAELTCIAAADQQSAPLPNQVVAVGTADGYVKLLDGETLKPHAQISVSRDLPRLLVVDLAPRDGLLLVAAADGGVRLLDIRAQKLQHVFRGHSGPVNACGFVGSRAFTASDDRTVKLWDLETGQLIKSLSTATPVSAASAHSRQGIIATGHQDGTIALWDERRADTLSMPTSTHRGCGPVVGVRVSPGGQALLSQAANGDLCSTDLENMQTALTLTGLGAASGPSPPAWSTDGTHIAARGASCINCWNSSSGELVHTHSGLATTAGLCWELPRVVAALRNGHATFFGSSVVGTDS